MRILTKSRRRGPKSDVCYICKRHKSENIGVICLTNFDVKNLQFCKLYKVLKARKPLCCECRLILHRCSLSLRITNRGAFPAPTLNKIKDSYCVICGHRKLLHSITVPPKSAMLLLLRKVLTQHVEFDAVMFLCSLCKSIVTDLLPFCKQEKIEQEISKKKAKEKNNVEDTEDSDSDSE